MSDEEYYRDEEFRELLNDYERAVNAGELVFFDVDDLADIADFYQHEERMEDAQAVIDRILELYPDSLVALNYYIRQALNNRDYANAEELLSRMDDKDSPEYIYSRAEIWLSQNEFERADNYLRKCLKDMPKEEYQDFVMDVVNIYTDYGYDDKSMEWIMRAYPDESDDFKELMGRTCFGVKAYDDAERIFNELIDKHPFQKRYWTALSNTQYMKEDYGAALTSSEYAIAIDPDEPEALIAKANALFRMENYEEALKYYERYTAKEPDDEFALLHEGTCLIVTNHFDKGIARLEHALEVAPEDSECLDEIYEEIVFAYNDQRMMKRALAYIDRSEKADCDHAVMEVLRGHVLLTNLYLEEAHKSFQKALDMADNPKPILLRIGASLFDNRMYNAAYVVYHMLLDNADETWTDGYGYMALCCYEQNLTDEYLKNLKEACRLNPSEAKILLSSMFPEEIKPEDYYEYAKKELKK